MKQLVEGREVVLSDFVLDSYNYKTEKKTKIFVHGSWMDETTSYEKQNRK